MSILKKSIRASFVSKPSLLLMCIGMACYGLPANAEHASHSYTFEIAQKQIKISGVVVDQNGEPIIGANVIVKGSTVGTITDIDGKFSFEGPSDGVLEISYVGFLTQNIKIKEGQSLKIVLKEDSKSLNEVVVVGYATQKKANLTGSVSAVNFKDVQSMPMANTASMLQGRLPGVVLTTNGAQAGVDDPVIRVRGVGTLGGGAKNNPMVLIDGVESTISQMSQLPPSDIASVSVLKDAASAAIYGVRAANGVILVTTKRGTDQKPTIDYSGSIAFQKATVLPDFADSYNWAKMWNECNPKQAYTKEQLEALKNGSDPDHLANTDWEREIFRTAPMHQHHLSISGGSKNVHYLISTQYFNQDGILKHTSTDRINFRSNLDAKLGRVKLGLNLSGSKQKISEPLVHVGGGDGTIMRYITWYTRPTVPVKYANGHYGYQDANSAFSASTYKNIVYQMTDEYGVTNNHNYRFDGKIFAEVDIIDGLVFRSSLAYKYFMNKTSRYQKLDAERYDAAGNVVVKRGAMNQLNVHNGFDDGYINENILTYKKQFGQHEISTLLGHSTQRMQFSVLGGSKQAFPTDNIYEIDGGTQNDHITGNANAVALQSFFGRINYNYGGKYLFEMNIRHDGSSRMPKAHRYATFPSFSGAWNITNEKFMQNVKFLNSLKLRASWGKLGNQEIGNYAYLETLAADANYYFGNDKNIGMRVPAVANDDIKWETTTITDFGFDAYFWKNKINVVFDWYDKTTSDILLQLPMPGSFLGNLGAPFQNAGKVRNRGWELAVNYNDQMGDWNWNAGFSLAGVKNKIIDIHGREDILGATINIEGQPIGSYYGLKAIGIYRTKEDLERKNANGQLIKQNGKAPQLGDIMYEDLNNDGNINDADRQIIGNPFPKLQYSFNLGFAWKNFDVSSFWQGVAGINRFNWESPNLNNNGGNRTTRWLDRWSPENINGSMPRLGNDFNGQNSSFWLTSADYLRLKNLEIGYTLRNNPFLAKVGMQSLRVYLAGTNLLTFTPLKDYDPEKGQGDTRNDVHPNTKTYSFGINIKF